MARRRPAPQSHVFRTGPVENVSDIGICLSFSLGLPASAGVRSKRGALQTRQERSWSRFHRQSK
jgi:hypothetical protein